MNKEYKILMSIELVIKAKTEDDALKMARAVVIDYSKIVEEEADFTIISVEE